MRCNSYLALCREFFSDACLHKGSMVFWVNPGMEQKLIDAWRLSAQEVIVHDNTTEKVRVLETVFKPFKMNFSITLGLKLV